MPNKLITAANARELLGGISAMTEWRYQRDETLNLPRPVKIRNRNFYREAEILEWINSREVAA
ncbi:hypothetical protein M3P36_08705 [Altererythrobacter sp. KTW20L]|uniref:helix-turn-helix transcriptional regulator n=1 Tax=Altererythrobacter sp. KTW20L TaxID=2942210 RepID=UPI0020C017A7|nr:hypothetical protein [Altererythrobacter sp. KTW20L]MCL6251120.1 hypothetical protein [Altererythrobacter sp. KTW20L]